MEKRPADGRPPRSQPAWKIAVVTLGNVVGEQVASPSRVLSLLSARLAGPVLKIIPNT